MGEESGMDYSSLSDVQLLARIVGPRVAGRIYQGALAPLFSPDKGGRAPGDPRQRAAPSSQAPLGRGTRRDTQCGARR